MNYSKHFSTKETPQTEPIPGSKQVKNSAGGFGFAVDNWTRLDRFLVLGSEAGSYYASERELTKENAKAVLECIKLDGKRAVNRIVEISKSGRAPKNDQAIFALSIAAGLGDPETKSLALNSLPIVCRIGTHLFQFAEAVQAFRGWGRSLRRSISNWYLDKAPEYLALQLVKYQQRNGWSHRDLLRLSHPKTTDIQVNSLFSWAVDKDRTEFIQEPNKVSKLITGFTIANSHVDVKPAEAAKIIAMYGLPRECCPTEWLKYPEVWDVLLTDMPMTAMIRNLGNMSKVGLLVPGSSSVLKVRSVLANTAKLKASRVHPITLLMAQRTYASGHSLKGHGEWQPVPQVIDALDEAFYAAFSNVEPTNKVISIGIDVSRSMGDTIAGTAITCCEGATALGLVTVHIESKCFIARFNGGYQALHFSAKTRLDDALRYTKNINGGSTDCALPMLDALKRNLKFDAFIVLTDNETWAGHIHPVQALRLYRDKTGIPAKLIVVGMVSNGFTIADPEDAGMLDVVGFDTAVPQLISDFVRV